MKNQLPSYNMLPVIILATLVVIIVIFAATFKHDETKQTSQVHKKITVISGGLIFATYISDGNVEMRINPPRCVFTDSKTKNYVTVIGNCIIEE